MLTSDGHLKIIDFGTARLFDREGRVPSIFNKLKEIQ